MTEYHARQLVLRWFRNFAHEPTDKPRGYWVEFGPDGSPEIEALVALLMEESE